MLLWAPLCLGMARGGGIAHHTLMTRWPQDAPGDEDNTTFRPHTFAKMRIECIRNFKEDAATDLAKYTAAELHKKAQANWVQSSERAKALSSMSDRELKRRRFL